MSNQTSLILIDGMTCNGCVKSIQGTLDDLKGVKSADISLAKHQATVMFDPDQISLNEIMKEIEETGFDARINDD